MLLSAQVLPTRDSIQTKSNKLVVHPNVSRLSAIQSNVKAPTNKIGTMCGRNFAKMENFQMFVNLKLIRKKRKSRIGKKIWIETFRKKIINPSKTKNTFYKNKIELWHEMVESAAWSWKTNVFFVVAIVEKNKWR